MVACFTVLSSQAGAKPPLGGTQLANYYDAAVTGIQFTLTPQIENRAMFASFSITHQAVDKSNHTGARVCGVGHWQSCVVYRELVPGEAHTGKVMTTAPLAGHNVAAQILVEPDLSCPRDQECFGGDGYTVDSAPIDVAAVYLVRLDEVTIHRSRAGPTYNDQVSATLAAQIGQPDPAVDLCKIDGGPNLVYCVLSRNEGFHTGIPFQINDMQVGPFVMIPEVDADLRVAYSMVAVNTGPAGTVGKVLNAISDAAAAFVSVVYPQTSGGISQADSFTKNLNNVMLADCDGPTLADVVIIPNMTRSNAFDSTLAYRTLAGDGVLGLSRDYDAQFTSPGSCGKAPFYTVRWSVRRASLKTFQ